MARPVAYVLSRYGEDLLVGCAEEVAAAMRRRREGETQEPRWVP